MPAGAADKPSGDDGKHSAVAMHSATDDPAKRPRHPPSIWDKARPAALCFQPVAEDVAVDLAIVGGGLVGLTTALAAAKAGLRVAVAEKDALAAGASGRTTGFVAPTLRPLPGGISLEAALGPDKAGRFRALAAGSGGAVFDLIDRNGLDVPTARAGWIEAAHMPAAFDRLRREAGAADQVLSASELRNITGLDAFHGGVLRAGSGAIDPKAYVLEIARVASEAGARIFEATPIEALDVTADGQAELRSGGWRIRAAHIVVATNGASNLIPQLAAGIIPVKVHQVVTAPLPGALKAAILSHGNVITDTRRNAIALRWTPDGRLLTGGLVPPSFASADTQAARFYSRRLERIAGPAARRLGLAPDLFKVQHVWHGRIALTGTGLPLLYAASPSVTALVACNGRGIALGTALGSALGAAIADGLSKGGGRVDLDALPLPATTPRRQPKRWVSGFGARLRAGVAEVLDWRDTRQ